MTPFALRLIALPLVSLLFALQPFGAQIEGTPAGGPLAVISPLSHDFGTVGVGLTSGAQIFTLTNDDQADLHISTAAITGLNPTNFSITSDACTGDTLATAETCDVAVAFAPIAYGAKLAALTIDSDSTAGLAESSLSGSAAVVDAFTTLAIVLDTQPDGPTDFIFGGDLGTFVLDDDSDAQRPNTRYFLNLAPGTYAVTQHATPKWVLARLACSNGQVTDLAHRTASVTLALGQTVTCTFTDARRRPDGSIAATAGGGFSGNDVYAAHVVPAQTSQLAIRAGRTREFRILVQNDGPDRDSFLVNAAVSGSRRFSVRFMRAGRDITNAVMAGTYRVTGLAPGAHVTIRAIVSAAEGMPIGATRNVDVQLISLTAPAARDFVRGHVTGR